MTKVDERIQLSSDQTENKKQKTAILDWLDNLDIARKGFILVAVPLSTVLVSVIILLFLLQQSEQELSREERLSKLGALSVSLMQTWTEIALSSATFAYTHEESYRERFTKYSHKSQATLSRMQELVAELPPEQKAASLQDLTKFRRLDASTTAVISSLLVQEQDGGLDFARQRNARLRMQAIAEEFASIQWKFKGRLDELEGQYSAVPARTRAMARALVIAFGILTIFISIYLAAFYSRSITRRLNIVMNNSIALAAHLPLNARLRGKEEIAKLDQVFHKMASGLQEASQRERAITENAAEVICSIDGELNFKEMNPACLRLWGYEPTSMIGKSVLQFVAQDGRDRTAAEFARGRETAQEAVIENSVVKQSGETAAMRWSLHWSKEASTFYCIAHDVTEQHEIERMKKEFVAMVSHDLRSPLSALQGSLSLFGKGAYGSLNEKGLITVERSHEDLSRLLGLIDSLLDLEKMESGKMQMMFSRIDMYSVVSRSVNAVLHLAQDESLSIEAQSASLECTGDEAKLVQVVVNLLSNAIKFSPRGGTISIKYQTTGNSIKVRVSDQGPGIPASRISAIFDRFEQIAPTDHSVKGGRGLGLAIAKSIVEAHGGTIGVESTEGAGSTFWFEFPAQQHNEGRNSNEELPDANSCS